MVSLVLSLVILAGASAFVVIKAKEAHMSVTAEIQTIIDDLKALAVNLKPAVPIDTTALDAANAKAADLQKQLAAAHDAATATAATDADNLKALQDEVAALKAMVGPAPTLQVIAPVA